MGNLNKDNVREIKIWKMAEQEKVLDSGGDAGMHSAGRKEARGERRPEVEEWAATTLLNRWMSGWRPSPGSVAR
jgi:hypothetical protein